jgi:hypothetical protein
MKKVRYAAGLAGLVPAAAGVMIPAAAHAATAAGSADQGAAAAVKTVALRHLQAAAAPAVAHVWSCFDKEPDGLYGWCNGSIVHGPAPFYPRNGGSYNLHDGSRVKITCFYSGKVVSGDKYWDHVVRETNRSGYFNYTSGHIADYYVSLGNQPPVGLLHSCANNG